MNTVPRLLASILNAADIVDVISAHRPNSLKPRGQVYICPCPFHEDNGNNLSVSKEKGEFHCYECKAHGNAIDFLAKYHKIPFAQAANDLADFLGLPGKIELDRASQSASLPPATKKLVDIHHGARDLYARALAGSPHAREYLQQRGLNEEIVASMGIGYAPPDWQTLATIFPNYQDPALVSAGLVVLSDENGRRYDRFRDRIMFPIRNEEGHIIGFGGRVLGKGEPKYLNSPETPLFSKSHELYGLFEAKQAIQEKGSVLVTEGYMDVVALHQHGWQASVATLGTATSGTHIEKLLRYTRRIIYGFDGDRAGLKAAWRALESALPYMQDDIQFQFLFLPDEHDPDSYLRAFGAAAFGLLCEKALSPAAFIESELRKRHGPDTLEGKSRLLEEVCEILRQMPVGQVRNSVTRIAAHMTGLEIADIAHLTGTPGVAESLSADAILPLPGTSFTRP